MRAAPNSRCSQLSSHHVPSLGSTKLGAHHTHPPPTLSQTRPSRPRATRSLSGQMPQPGFPPSRARRKSRFRADERRLGSGRRCEPVRPRSAAMEARPTAPSSARRPAGTPPPPRGGRGPRLCTPAAPSRAHPVAAGLEAAHAAYSVPAAGPGSAAARAGASRPAAERGRHQEAGEPPRRSAARRLTRCRIRLNMVAGPGAAGRSRPRRKETAGPRAAPPPPRRSPARPARPVTAAAAGRRGSRRGGTEPRRAAPAPPRRGPGRAGPGRRRRRGVEPQPC